MFAGVRHNPPAMSAPTITDAGRPRHWDDHRRNDDAGDDRRRAGRGDHRRHRVERADGRRMDAGPQINCHEPMPRCEPVAASCGRGPVQLAVRRWLPCPHTSDRGLHAERRRVGLKNLSRV